MLSRRGLVLDTRCTMSCHLDEDCGHLFFRYKMVKQVRRWLGLGEERKILLNKSSGPEVLETILAFNEESKLTKILLLWCWWHARNKVMNQGERRCVFEKICCLLSSHVYAETQTINPYSYKASIATMVSAFRWYLQNKLWRVLFSKHQRRGLGMYHGKPQRWILGCRGWNASGSI